jgi:quercetin 2,3-dioxygenase
MSGPVASKDVLPAPAPATTPGPAPVIAPVITPSREAEVGGLRVRRALPRRDRRTIGAWCFVDHMGPARVTPASPFDVAPHPHMGLQTVTWLIAGEVVHRDSLGSEQVIRPGQLNLMTAGHGVAHSEEHAGAYRGELAGVQLWVAQPASTRDGAAAFEHHPELPKLDLGGGCIATVLVGELAGAVSPARQDTDHVGVDLDLRAGRTVIPLRPDFEYGLVMLTGAAGIDGGEEPVVEPGHLAFLGTGRTEVPLSTERQARALLVGGTPFPEAVLMWWNFVARTQDEITAAYRDWSGRADRFGAVPSDLDRTEVGPPPWVRDKAQA